MDVAVKLENGEAAEGRTEKISGIKSKTLEGRVVTPVVTKATNKGEVRTKEGSIGLRNLLLQGMTERWE